MISSTMNFSIIIILVSVIIIITDADREVTFKNKRYLMTQRDMTIIENRALCQAQGMTLAFIRDEAENTFLKSHVVNYLRLGAVWNRTSKVFEWEDGTPMTYTNWNSATTCGESNFCCSVEMVSSGKWNIYTCGSQAHALCEHNGEKVPSAINSLNDSLNALKEETDMKLVNLIVKLDEWTQNITHHVNEIVKDSVLEIVKEETTKLINNSQTNDIEAKLTNLTSSIDAKLEKVVQDRISDEAKMKEEIKSIGNSIEAINNSKNTLKNEIMNEMKDELDTIRNATNNVVIEKSKMIHLINDLEYEKDQMSHKLVENENSVDHLSTRIFVSLTITILLLLAFIITIGYKFYHDRKPILLGFKKHHPPSSQSIDTNSVQDDFV